MKSDHPTPRADRNGEVGRGFQAGHGLCCPRRHASVPIGAKPVTFQNGETSTPGFTYGYALTVGIEIVLQRSVCLEGRTPPRLQLGFSLYRATSYDDATDSGGQKISGPSDHVGIGLALGFEFPL